MTTPVAQTRTEWVSIPGPQVPITAFVARPGHDAPVPVVVVVHENPGITEWRQQETVRLSSEWGYALVVMSTYSRIGATPPQGPFATPDERRRAAFLAMPDDQVARDLDVTMAWVRAQSGFRADAVGLLGFCSGGGQAFYAACTRPDIADCLVVIYGNIVLRGEFTTDRVPLDRIPLVSGLRAPMQGHFGSRDHEVPPAHVDRLERELAATGKTAEIHRYPDAGHVFSDRTHPNYDDAATRLMWGRVQDFLGRHLGGSRVGGGC
jgi:carboxymethylenebutenolidase